MQYLRSLATLFLALPTLILAGDIRFFVEKDCNGAVLHEYNVVACGVCITPPEESSAALVDNVSDRHLVTVYNKQDCAGDSIVLENFGSLCGIQGANKIRSVMIHCIEGVGAAPLRRKRSAHF